MAKPKIKEQEIYFGCHDAKASGLAKTSEKKWRMLGSKRMALKTNLINYRRK